MPSSSDGYYRDKSDRTSKHNPYQPYIPRPPKKTSSSLDSGRAMSENKRTYSSANVNGRSDDDLSSFKRHPDDSNTADSPDSSSFAPHHKDLYPLPSSLPRIGRISKDPNARNESDQDRINNLRLENTKHEEHIDRLRDLVARLEDKDIKIKSKIQGPSLVKSSEYLENLKLLTDTKRKLESLEKAKSDNEYTIHRLQTSLNNDPSNSSANGTKKSVPVIIDSVKFVTSEVTPVDQSEVEDSPTIEFFDISDHWCQQCDSFSSTLDEYLQHLHTEEHFSKTPKDRSRPWPMKRRLSQYDVDRKLLPIQGSEFLVPCKGFYCIICRVFLGDDEVATEHMFSLHHNKVSKSVSSSRPEYAKVFEQDKSAALARKKADERQKQKEAVEKAIEEQNRLEASQMKEQAKRAKEAAERARLEETQRKAEQEAERARRLEAERQTIMNAKALKKTSKTPCARNKESATSKSPTSHDSRSINKRKRSRTSDSATSDALHKKSKKLKPEEVVLRECSVLITFDDQDVAVELIEEAKFFKFGSQIHKFNDEDQTWSSEPDPQSVNDLELLDGLDDQTATDDEAYAADDPMLESSIHDQILNALDTVVKNAPPRDSPSTAENSSFFSKQHNKFERPSTPNKQSIGSSAFDSSPCSIITGSDVILSKQCSIDGGSILSGGCPEEANEATDDGELNLNLEIPQLNLDVLANDE